MECSVNQNQSHFLERNTSHRQNSIANCFSPQIVCPMDFPPKRPNQRPPPKKIGRADNYGCEVKDLRQPNRAHPPETNQTNLPNHRRCPQPRAVRIHAQRDHHSLGRIFVVKGRCVAQSRRGNSPDSPLTTTPTFKIKFVNHPTAPHPRGLLRWAD